MAASGVSLKWLTGLALALVIFVGRTVDGAPTDVDTYAYSCGYGHRACPEGYECYETSTCGFPGSYLEERATVTRLD